MATPVTCLQCMVCSVGATEFRRGWRAYRGSEGRKPVIVVLCPDCAERELGEDSR